MQISMNGYSTIYSNLQQAKQTLLSGNYFTAGNTNDANVTKVSASEFEEETGLSTADLNRIGDESINITEGKEKAEGELSGMSEEFPLFKFYQKEICDLTDGVAESSGLSHNLSHDLGLDQSFSSIDDLVKAIDTACLDIRA
jgi:hypothetical protein